MFVKLECLASDVKNGFWHIVVDEESSRLLTFATPFGCYRWTRMPFGISPAPEIFQSCLEQQLVGLEGVTNIHDDILVIGEGDTVAKAIETHDQRVHKLLEHCVERNIVLNTGEKFSLRKSELPYVGHVFTDLGLKANPNKVEAIQQFPTPVDLPGLRRFLGMANYLSKFVPALSKMVEPLRRLTQKDTPWMWSDDCDKAVQDVRSAITNAAILKYFDPEGQCKVQCDASLNGLGAVVLQNFQPVAFASRSLTLAEKNYAQIEKELLAIVFALRRFDQYVYGLKILVE